MCPYGLSEMENIEQREGAVKEYIYLYVYKYINLYVYTQIYDIYF